MGKTRSTINHSQWGRTSLLRTAITGASSEQKSGHLRWDCAILSTSKLFEHWRHVDLLWFSPVSSLVTTNKTSKQQNLIELELIIFVWRWRSCLTIEWHHPDPSECCYSSTQLLLQYRPSIILYHWVCSTETPFGTTPCWLCNILKCKVSSSSNNSIWSPFNLIHWLMDQWDLVLKPWVSHHHLGSLKPDVTILDKEARAEDDTLRHKGHTMVATCESWGSHILKHPLFCYPFSSKWDHKLQTWPRRETSDCDHEETEYWGNNSSKRFAIISLLFETSGVSPYWSLERMFCPIFFFMFAPYFSFLIPAWLSWEK